MNRIQNHPYWKALKPAADRLNEKGAFLSFVISVGTLYFLRRQDLPTIRMLCNLSLFLRIQKLGELIRRLLHGGVERFLNDLKSCAEVELKNQNTLELGILQERGICNGSTLSCPLQLNADLFSDVTGNLYVFLCQSDGFKLHFKRCWNEFPYSEK